MNLIHKFGFTGQIQQTHRVFILFIMMIIAFLPFNTVSAIQPQQQQIVKKVVDAFKQNNRIALSEMVSYPLFRQAPLAPINNQKEFLQRYDEVFDRYLLNTIVTSNLNTDWDNIGWKGVILGNGIVALDPEGNITEINHHSQREQALVTQLARGRIAKKGRQALHRSVTNYNQAVVEVSTKRFHIRVDNVGQGQLRYSSWSINKPMSDKPDLILSNGQVIKNGRNQRFVFDNGSYSYQLNIDNSVTNNRVSGNLQVFKSGQAWISEEATQIVRR